MNENPAIVTWVTGGVILIVVIIIIWQLVGGRTGPVTYDSPTQSFYSNDDGATWFADDAKKIPPFMKDGKPAYKAMVYTCNGGAPFVAYLQRYKADTKKQIEDGLAHGVPVGMGVTAASIEIKAPKTGDDPKKWMVQMDPRTSGILNVKCPDNSPPIPQAP
jgi:hypothetical protein